MHLMYVFNILKLYSLNYLFDYVFQYNYFLFRFFQKDRYKNHQYNLKKIINHKDLYGEKYL